MVTNNNPERAGVVGEVEPKDPGGSERAAGSKEAGGDGRDRRREVRQRVGVKDLGRVVPDKSGKCLYQPKGTEEGALSFSRYRLFQTIGEGSFAKVKLARHSITGKQVAIKILEKKRIKDQYIIRNLYREAFLLRRLWHPNIIHLYEVFETSDHY